MRLIDLTKQIKVEITLSEMFCDIDDHNFKIAQWTKGTISRVEIHNMKVNHIRSYHENIFADSDA